MANHTPTGSEFQNISETWDQNERKRDSGNAPQNENTGDNGAMPKNTFEQLIKEGAAAYDSEAKENQLLSGDRATLNDTIDADDSGE